MDTPDILKELEHHQYRDIYFEEDVPFRNDSNRLFAKMVYFGLGLFLVVVILCFIIRIPREVNLSFNVTGGLIERVYQFSDKVFISEKHVESGGFVNENQKLVTISSPRIASLIEELETAEINIRDFESNRIVSFDAEYNLIVTEDKGLTNELQNIKNELSVNREAKKRELEHLVEQEKMEQRQYERNKLLHASNVIPDLQLDNSYKDLQEIKSQYSTVEEKYDIALAQLQSEMTRLLGNKEILAKKLDKLKADLNLEEVKLKSALHLVKEKIKLNFGNVEVSEGCFIIRSPQKGSVSFIAENEALVEPGQILLRLKTDTTKFQVQALAKPKHIGLLKVNDKAVIKYSSFPHYYYGTMHGTVVSTSPSPNENGLFPVTIAITDTRRLNGLIKKGMTGTVSIVLENKPIINHIFRKFLSAITFDENLK